MDVFQVHQQLLTNYEAFTGGRGSGGLSADETRGSPRGIELPSGDVSGSPCGRGYLEDNHVIWQRRQRKYPIVDLGAHPDVTTTLLREPSWRSRVVEQIDIDRAISARNVRSLQAAPLVEYLSEYLPPGNVEKIRIALPVATLPKRPLVNFDLRTGSSEALLLRRREIAERQAHYISQLASELGIGVSNDALDYVTAICEFTPGPWKQYCPEGLNGDSHADLHAYLADGLKVSISDSTFERWLASSQRIGAVLWEALDEGYDVFSSADNPLVALPLLFSTRNPASEEKIDRFLEEMASFVESCVRLDGSYALPLEVLADYGRRYEALVYCTVPVQEPFIVRMPQELPLTIDKLGRAELDVVFNDALSNHITIRILDPDVELTRFEARKLGSDDVGNSFFTSTRTSREEIAVYGSEADRSYRILLRFRLTPSRLANTVTLSILTTTMIAILLIVTVRPLTSDDVALLVVPTTFAAGLLLVQQRTTIAASLQAPLRFAVIAVLLTLWCIVGLGYWTGYIRTG